MARRSGGQPTLRDVADLALTSTAVVSYVVNSGPKPVSEPTRQRVLAAIDELGYRPNRAARTLASNKSKIIGLVVPDSKNPFFADLITAVERSARARGLITVVGNGDYIAAQEQSYVEAFDDYGSDGIIVVAGDLESTWDVSLSTPHVFLHRRPVGAVGSLISAANERGAALAVDHLLGTGRGQVHCVTGTERSGPVESRAVSWRARVETELGPEAGGSGLVRVSYAPGDAAPELSEWLKGLTFPTAVFVTTDVQALGLLSACASLGVRVPRDLAIVSYDDCSASDYSIPALTCVSMPYADMAEAALDCLIDPMSAKHDMECGHVELVVRSSCGAAPHLSAS